MSETTEQRLTKLEGRVLALQAVNGILLNMVAETLDERHHLRDIISRMMDGVDFSTVPGYSEVGKAQLTEGFFSCLNEMSDKIIVEH